MVERNSLGRFPNGKAALQAMRLGIPGYLTITREIGEVLAAGSANLRTTVVSATEDVMNNAETTPSVIGSVNTDEQFERLRQKYNEARTALEFSYDRDPEVGKPFSPEGKRALHVTTPAGKTVSEYVRPFGFFANHTPRLSFPLFFQICMEEEFGEEFVTSMERVAPTSDEE